MRQELFASTFWSDSFYASSFGGSYQNNYRGQLEERTVVSLTSHYTMAFGYAFARGEARIRLSTTRAAAFFRSNAINRDSTGRTASNSVAAYSSTRELAKRSFKPAASPRTRLSRGRNFRRTQS